MSYTKLVSEFLEDEVQTHSPQLHLHNPCFDRRIKHPFPNNTLDWLHDEPRKDLAVQFIGSHYSNLNWLLNEKEGLKNEPNTKVYEFLERLRRLGITDRFRLGNCAQGYIPDLARPTGYFTAEQIKYLRPRKLREYAATGTKAIFTLGSPSLDFHLYGTGHQFSRFADAVGHPPIELEDGLLLIPLPHPGTQGIMNYMRALKSPDLSKRAQDLTFSQLVNHGLDLLRRRGVDGAGRDLPIVA